MPGLCFDILECYHLATTRRSSPSLAQSIMAHVFQVLSSRCDLGWCCTDMHCSVVDLLSVYMVQLIALHQMYIWKLQLWLMLLLSSSFQLILTNQWGLGNCWKF